MTRNRATAFAPGSIGNVGPGFDVLGLAFDGLGDRVTVELTKRESRVDAITGRDAELVPRDASLNAAAIAANAYLQPYGFRAIVTLDKGLPLAAGMGGSAASSVAGAYAAGLALGQSPQPREVIAAALEGESAVAGRHLDNIVPSVFGGLGLSRCTDPIDATKLPVNADWWLALVTPQVRIETKEARALLPNETDRATWIQQMANTTALVHAFATGDAALLGRALDDRYAEPRRASLIPNFFEAKRAALDAGAFACTISGSGPTLFAIAADERAARACAEAMERALGDVKLTHVARIAREGVRNAEFLGVPRVPRSSSEEPATRGTPRNSEEPEEL
ncbi:MAG: homoserine kinase [Acidobacteriota bacterium]|nr:homoserine kinase [Acidobacteriota bacterium]